MSLWSTSRVLVIGAGVSGCTAAIRFAHHGCDVTLMERAVFPREKICGCCLGAAGLSALDAIDIGDHVRQLGTLTHTFVSYLINDRNRSSQDFSRSVPSPVRLNLTPGVAISRSVLDAFLIEQAGQQGVRVLQPFDAQVVDSDHASTLIRYRHAHPSSSWVLTDQYDLVVAATGLSGVFAGGARDAHGQGDRSVDDCDSSSAPAWEHRTGRWGLPWIEPPHGPLGIATHLPSNHPATRDWHLPDGEIQMICGSEGYVGLVRLPGGEIDIAAALRSQRQNRLKPNGNPGSNPRHRADTTTRLLELLRCHPDSGTAVDDSLAAWLNDRANVMTAPPLRRRRYPGAGRVVAIGDCAGYVEPMTGEGMTWGIESGLAVADLWQQESTRSDFAARWNGKLQGLQRKRRVLCSSVTQAMRSLAVRRATHFVLGGAPWLATPITRGLATGHPFSTTQG